MAYAFKHKITLIVESTESEDNYEDASQTAYVSMVGFLNMIKKEFKSADFEIIDDDIEELEHEKEKDYPEDSMDI